LLARQLGHRFSSAQLAYSQPGTLSIHAAPECQSTDGP
jgi:hypothetical protein